MITETRRAVPNAWVHAGVKKTVDARKGVVVIRDIKDPVVVRNTHAK